MAHKDHKIFGCPFTGFPPPATQSPATILPSWVFAKVVDQLTTAVCIMDATANILYVNQAFFEMTSTRFLYTLRETLCKELSEDAARRGQPFRDLEISLDPGNQGEPRWFACSGIWFCKPEDAAAHCPQAYCAHSAQPVTCLLVMINDITTLKRQQEAVGMNAMRALLAEQERVRSMREALQAVIFQMQGPLNLIAAAHDLLARRSAQTDPALRQALQSATVAGQEALERLRTLVPQVPPEAEGPVNINQLLREVLELDKQRLLAGGMVVDWRPAPMLPSIMARASRLRGMFKQLLDNALDAMESNRHELRELRIMTGLEERTVFVVIEDSGPGVPPHLHWRIFEPFFTTKRAATHVGLGLTMVQEVVNEQCGLIRLDPDCGTGCRWRVSLPIRPVDAV